MRTSGGYPYFFKRAFNFDSEWGTFDGSCQKIPEDDNDKPLSNQPPQSHDNMRESNDNPREVHSISFQYEDIKTLKTRPIPSDFNIQR